MKILQIINYPGQGGAEQVAYNIAKCAKEEGYEADFIFGGEGPLVKKVKNMGCRVDIIDMPTFYNLGAILRLRKYFKKNKPDIVITHFLRENFLAVEASRLTSVKKIYSFVHRIEPKTKAQSFLNKAFSRGMTGFIAVSPLAEDYLLKEGVKKDKIRVIKNGVEIGIFDEARIRKELGLKSEKIITYVGRFTEEKGHKILLDAFSELSLENTILVLVGDGALREKMILYAKKLGMYDKIRFTGGRDKAYEIIGVSDLYIQPSDIEVMPLSVIEAMMLGVPTLLSDIEAHKVISNNWELGTSFNQKDKIDLAKKIKTALEKKDELKAVTEKAKKYAQKNYSLEKMWSSLKEIF